ncbi:MAG: hypothetical protein U9R77_03620 [Pseudomonadota bacterium]|uniref:hypothetical protein n=1 Tax=Sphingobium naphthae TaxID=1886786 RepID=UPI002B11DEE2|nr:hypothetical protein [Pseudomonadota bacterium]
MTLFWKGAAALSLAIAGLGAAATPAQAQYHGGYGWRDGREVRWDNRRWDDRRWDNGRRWDGRRHWRGQRDYYRPHYRYRPRCWTEWRYDRWRHRDVRVRICR